MAGISNCAHDYVNTCAEDCSGNLWRAVTLLRYWLKTWWHMTWGFNDV